LSTVGGDVVVWRVGARKPCAPTRKEGIDHRSSQILTDKERIAGLGSKSVLICVDLWLIGLWMGIQIQKVWEYSAV